MGLTSSAAACCWPRSCQLLYAGRSSAPSDAAAAVLAFQPSRKPGCLVLQLREPTCARKTTARDDGIRFPLAGAREGREGQIPEQRGQAMSSVWRLAPRSEPRNLPKCQPWSRRAHPPRARLFLQDGPSPTGPSWAIRRPSITIGTPAGPSAPPRTSAGRGVRGTPPSTRAAACLSPWGLRLPCSSRGSTDEGTPPAPVCFFSSVDGCHAPSRRPASLVLPSTGFGASSRTQAGPGGLPFAVAGPPVPRPCRRFGPG